MTAPFAWLRSRRVVRILDVVLVASAFAIGVIGHIAARSDETVEAAPLGLPILMFAALAAATLWWRRTRPLLALGLLVAIAILAGSVGDPALFTMQLGLEVMVLFHAAGSWCNRRRLAAGAAVGFGAVILVAAIADESTILAAAAFAVALVGFPFAAGYAARVRRQYLEQVERRLADAERDRDERARRAIADERTRIARELHDVVAHHVSLIGVQAGAARSAHGRSPQATIEALEAIESSSRAAVGEMRRLLTVLAPRADDPATWQPQPGLGDVPALIERLRAAGVAVTLRSDAGDVVDLEPALSLTCYRILEESLTNVVKHSLARELSIELTVTADSVRLSVRDPGPHRRRGRHDEGRGLRGMADRVALFTGTLDAFESPTGGFCVEAAVPRVPR